MLKIWGMVLLMMARGCVAWAGDAPASVPGTMSALRAQMEQERSKEQELQLLQLEVDRLKLEVEKKKAVLELGKMDAVRSDGVPSAGPAAPPSVVLKYLFMGGGRKEAVFSVDGDERHVQEGDALGGQVVKAVLAEGVSLKGKDGTENSFRIGR